MASTVLSDHQFAASTPPSHHQALNRCLPFTLPESAAESAVGSSSERKDSEAVAVRGSALITLASGSQSQASLISLGAGMHRNTLQDPHAQSSRPMDVLPPISSPLDNLPRSLAPPQEQHHGAEQHSDAQAPKELAAPTTHGLADSVPGPSERLSSIHDMIASGGEALGPREKLLGSDHVERAEGSLTYPRLPSVSSITNPLVGLLSGGAQGNQMQELASMAYFSELNRHLIQSPKSKPSPEFPRGLPAASSSSGAPPALPRGALGERAQGQSASSFSQPSDRMVSMGPSSTRSLNLTGSHHYQHQHLQAQAPSSPDIFRKGAMGNLPAPKPSTLPAPRLRYNLPESSNSPIAASVRSVLDSKVAPFKATEMPQDLSSAFPKAPANSPTLSAIADIRSGKDTPLTTKNTKNELVPLKLEASGEANRPKQAASKDPNDDGCDFLLKAAMELASFQKVSPEQVPPHGRQEAMAAAQGVVSKKKLGFDSSGRTSDGGLGLASWDGSSGTPGKKEAHQKQEASLMLDAAGSSTSVRRPTFTKEYKQKALLLAKEVVPGGKGPGSTLGMRAAAERLNIQVTMLREWGKQMRMGKIAGVSTINPADLSAGADQQAPASRRPPSPGGPASREARMDPISPSTRPKEGKAKSPGSKAQMQNLLVDVSPPSSGSISSMSPRNERLRDRRWWAVGRFVEVHFDGDWWQATVLDAKSGEHESEVQIYVDYIGGGEEEREWLSIKSGRVRAPTEEWNKAAIPGLTQAKSPAKSLPKSPSKSIKDKGKKVTTHKSEAFGVSPGSGKKRASEISSTKELESPAKKLKIKTESPRTSLSDGGDSPSSARRRAIHKFDTSYRSPPPRMHGLNDSISYEQESDFGPDRAMNEAMKLAAIYKQESRGGLVAKIARKGKGDDKTDEGSRPESPKRYRGVSLHLGKWTSRAHLKMQVISLLRI